MDEENQIEELERQIAELTSKQVVLNHALLALMAYIRWQYDYVKTNDVSSFVAAYIEKADFSAQIPQSSLSEEQVRAFAHSLPSDVQQIAKEMMSDWP